MYSRKDLDKKKHPYRDKGTKSPRPYKRKPKVIELDEQGPYKLPSFLKEVIVEEQ